MFGRQAQAPKQYAVWQALPGSQSLFLSSPVREVCFAGSRGPGKTDAMLMSFAQYCGRGYGDYFRGVIFRRNYKHLDDIIAKSKRWFNKSAQQPRFLAGSSSLKWVWPTGEELLLRAFEDENDYWSYHGHEYCVEVGTLVKTPNGLVPIEQLKVGDEVITPGGIDHVTRTFAPKIKECVKADFYDADRRLIAQQVQSAEHRLLTTSQTQCTQLGKTPRIGSLECEQFDAPFGHAQEPLARTTQWHSYKSLLETDQGSPEVCVSQRGENSLGISDFRQLQVFLQSYIQTSRGEAVWLEALFHRLNEFCLPKSTQYYFLYKLSEQELNLLVKNALVLLGQLLQCEQPQLAQGLGALRENASAQHCLQKLQDYLGYYRSLQDCGDEQFLLAQVGVPTSIPLQDGAVVRAHAGLLLDGQGQIRTHSRCQAATFFPNPYEAGSEVPADQIGFVEVEMRPCGPRLTVDITVGKNKMYITNSGIVNSNCFIGWEELTSWPSINCYESMKSCNRSSFQPTARLPSIPRLIRSSTNPYGVGHSWVKNYFIDPAPYGKIIQDPDGGNQRVALFGSVRENPFLGEEYIKTLESITDANKRKAWLEGSWDITSGGMFDDLWSADKHVIKPFDIPHSWRITRSFDWGSSKPFSCGWWAVSDGTEATLKDGRKIAFPRKTVFRIGEWYGCEEGKPNTGLRLPAKVVAQGILIRETQMRIQNRVQPGPADSAIYAVTDEASIGQNMEAEGVFWTPADKRPGSRKNGWELMRDRMDAVAKAEDKPGMYVFDTCRDFIRTVPNIARDQRDPDDVDCFVAGTLISCPSGQIPIEQLKVGDFVNTPIGPRKLLKAGVAGNGVPQQVTTITLSNGQKLCGTLDHKIYVEKAGLRPLCRLLLGDTLNTEENLSWLNPKFKSITEWLTDVMPIPKRVYSTHNTLSAVQLTLSKWEPVCCTELSGKPREAQSLREWTSTTRTTTKLTTALKTLNFKLKQIMQDTTCKEDLLTVGISPQLLLLGEKASKDKRYLERILKSAVKTLPSDNLRALIVAALLQHSTHEKQYATQKNASLNRADAPKKKSSVLFAVLQSLLNPTQPKKSKPVVTHVDGHCAKEKVYYLTVDQAHLFYANGVLSTNTDAEDHIADDARYMVLSADHVVHRVKISGA